jgi:hypothetical protein
MVKELLIMEEGMLSGLGEEMHKVEVEEVATFDAILGFKDDCEEIGFSSLCMLRVLGVGRLL